MDAQPLNFSFSHHLYIAFLWSRSFLVLNTPSTPLFLSDLNFLRSHFCRHRNPNRGKRKAWHRVADALDFEVIPGKDAATLSPSLISAFWTPHGFILCQQCDFSWKNCSNLTAVLVSCSSSMEQGVWALWPSIRDTNTDWEQQYGKGRLQKQQDCIHGVNVTLKWVLILHCSALTPTEFGTTHTGKT